MTEDQYALAVRNELDGLALDVHRIISATSPDEAMTTLDYIQRKVESTGNAILELPAPSGRSDR